MPAGLFYRPYDLAQTRYTSSDISQRDGPRLCDERVGTSSLEELYKSGMRLVVGDEDGCEAVESAGEQNCQELETVWQVYGDSLGVVLLQVLANDGDLLGDSSNVVLGDLLLAQDGHNGRSAAGAGPLLQRYLASDTAPDVAEVAIFASRVHGCARRLDGESGSQRVCPSYQLSGRQCLEISQHTAMRGFGRPEDCRLSRLPHIRGLSLSSKQQWVRVSICVVGDHPAYESQDGDKQHGREYVPALEQVGNRFVQLLHEAGHRGSTEGTEEVKESRVKL